MSTVSCRRVVKRFGDVTALNKVSVEMPEGKIFGLLGPNGAGKTTLIRIINQIFMADEGEVLFNGRPLRPDDVLRMGYLPEERGLYKKMRVGEQAIYLAKLKGMSAAEATRELKEWFEKFELHEWWNKKVEELSKGMAQKIQFITTVIHKPELLILDEPFSGFDPLNVQLIRDEILDMKANGTTIILSTHNMESVEELCDNIALIDKAKLILTGGVDQIRHDYGNNMVEVVYRADQKVNIPQSDLFEVLSDTKFHSNRKSVLSVREHASSSDILSELIRSLDIVSYQVVMPRMKDIFIKLVSES